MASLRKRPKSEYWVCCYTTSDGRRTQRSTGSIDKDEAMMVCRQWENEARLEREGEETLVAASGPRDRGRRLIWAAAAVAVLLQVGVFWWFSKAAPAPVSLLVEIDKSEQVPTKFSEQEFSKRHRWVRINEEALKAFDEKKWEFTLNLFADETHRVDVAAYRKHYHGAKSVVGLIENDLHTSVVLSKRDSRRKVMAGSVALADGRRFLITHAGEGQHVVIEIDMDKMPGQGNRTADLTPPPEVPKEEKKGKGVGVNDHRYGKPETELAMAERAKYMDSHGLARRMMAAAGINPSNAGYGFYGRGGTSSSTGLTQGPTTPARILYQRAGTTEFIDILFVYEQNLLATSFNNDVKDMQLKLDNLMEDTNLVFKKCLIPLELRQAVLDATNDDPATGEPVVADNMIFKASARAWTGGAGNSTAVATANIDGNVRDIGVIPGEEGPAWGMDQAPTKAVYDSIVGSATRGRWTVPPVMGTYRPLYDVPNFGGDTDAAMNWITDAHNSLIFGDQYWPEPYINLPEGYQWRLLPVALDTNATYNVDSSQSPAPDNVPGLARADFLVMDYTSIENPDIYSGPIDSGRYDSVSPMRSTAVSPLIANFTSPYGETGEAAVLDDAALAAGGVPILVTAELREYFDEDEGGSLQRKLSGRFTGTYPTAAGRPPTDPGAATPSRDQIKPNYYVFNEDAEDTLATYDSKGGGVQGTVDTDIDHFTAIGGQTLGDGNRTSFSDVIGMNLVMPLTMNWLDFGNSVWARTVGTDQYTFHYSANGANAAIPAAVSGFAINSTYNILTKTGHLLTEGTVFESNSTVIPKNRPYYVEKIDNNRIFLRTTSGFFPAGAGKIDPKRINSSNSAYGTWGGAPSLTQNGIDTFTIPNHGLNTGDQVFFTEDDRGLIPVRASNAEATLNSPAITRNTHYDVYRWDSDNVSLHRIKNADTKPALKAYYAMDGAGYTNTIVLDQSKTGNLVIVAGAGAVPSDVNGSATSAGLVIYYPMDYNGTLTDATGRLPDHSGNDNNGTVGGPFPLHPDRHGDANSSYSFDGIDDQINSRFHVNFTSVTMSAWIKTSDTNATIRPGIVSSVLTGNNDHAQMVMRDGRLSAEILDGDAVTPKSKHYIAEDVVINDDKWHLVTFTYDRATGALVLYVDGTARTPTKVLDETITGGFTVTEQARVGVARNSTDFFKGWIDEVRIYNRALTASEVGQLFIKQSPFSLALTASASGPKTLVKAVVANQQSAPGGANLTKRQLIKQALAKHPKGVPCDLCETRDGVTQLVNDKLKPKPIDVEIIDKAQTYPQLKMGRSVISPKVTGRRAVYRGINFPGSRKAPEETARQFLTQVSGQLFLKKDLADLKLINIKRGLASSHTHFQQYINNIPVLGASVMVSQGPTGGVQAVHLQYFSSLKLPASKQAAKTFAEVLPGARAATGIKGKPFLPAKGKLYWYPQADGTAKLVYQTTIGSPQVVGSFYTLIDANTGEVIQLYNNIKFADGVTDGTTGIGYVYWPNPWQTKPGPSTGTTGTIGTMTDHNGTSGDGNSTDLWNQRVQVTLKGLDGSGQLKGEFVDTTVLGPAAPHNAYPVANELATRVYNYSRDNKRFEQVMAYHVIDSMQRHFHSIGFDDQNSSNASGLRDRQTVVVAHLSDAPLTANYNPNTDRISFADGNNTAGDIDLAEDGDVIAHEYTHAILSSVQPASNIGAEIKGVSEWGAMHEGTGDFVAAAFFADDGNATYQASHAAKVHEWATSSGNFLAATGNGIIPGPPYLRRVDTTKKYDTDWVGAIHADGEIWSGALWDLRLDIIANFVDPSIVDRLLWSAFLATPALPQTMKDVAVLMWIEDQNIYSGVHEANIRTAFNNRKITQDVDYPITGNTVAGVAGEATLRTYAYISSVAAPTSNIGPFLPKPGRFYFADSNATTDTGGVYHVRRVDGNGSYATIAGGGSASPDAGVEATTVKLTDIDDIAVDGEYRVFIAGGDTQKVYRVNTAGMMERVAGGGATSPDQNASLDPLDANLGTVVSIAVRVNSSAPVSVPRAGGTEMWIADKVGDDYFVRYIWDADSTDGQLNIVTVAGGGVTDFDTNATDALDNWFRNIDDIAVDSLGQVFIADNVRQVVRRLNIVGSVPPTGQAAPPGSTTIVAGVDTVAGGGDDTVPFDGNATLKRIGAVSVAVDSGNNLFIAGSTPNSGQRIRKVYLGSGTIPPVFSNGSGEMITVAGGGTVGLDLAYSGGLVFARQAVFTPTLQEVAVDIEGNIFIDDVNATESVIWKVNKEQDTDMPWTDGQIVYLVDTNSTSPSRWPALPPYTGYSFPANMRDNVGNVTYHGPFWVNVDENAIDNPDINRFWLSTEPNGRFINGTWTNFGTSNSETFDALKTVMLDNYGSFYLVEGNSLDVTITQGWDGPTNCDLVKTSRLDLLTDAANINLRPSEQVDFVYRQGDSVMSGANPLVITPGIFDPAYSGVIGVTTNNAVITAGGLRMALNTGSRTSGATQFGGLKTEAQRYEILHDANGTFRFNGDLYETPQRIMDARADLVCLLIGGGGGGLGQYYTKSARGPVAIPDMIQDSTRLEDVKRNDHPNVIRNRDGINYSVCAWDGSMPYYVFAAEVGHNLGCGHGLGDRNGNVGIPVNPMDYKNTGISKGQDNTTFSPYRNDRISTPEFPQGSGALVKDSYIALGTYFTAKNSTQGKFGTISVYTGLPGGRPAFRKVGLFSSPLIYYQGTNIGEQYGWRIPPPQGRYNEPLPFDNAKAMTTVGTVVAFYRDSNGAGRTGPEEVIVPEPPGGIISAMPGRGQNTGTRRNSKGPVSYAPGVVPLPGSLPNIQYAAAPAAKAGGTGLGAATNPTAPKPGGLPAGTNPVNPKPKPGGGIGGTTNPPPPPVTTTPGLRNDNFSSVWPAAGKAITAPEAVFPARPFGVLDSTNRGATPGAYDSPLTGRRTVWFRWNAPAAPGGGGRVTISTKGSDFDTIIKVVDPKTIKDPKTGNKDGDPKDNARTGPWSEETYPWSPGQVFLICVDGVDGAQGRIRISAQIK